MKLIIEAEPKEAAEFIAEFAGAAHRVCARGEQDVVDMFLRSIQEPQKKKGITDEEVPAGGYFQ